MKYRLCLLLIFTRSVFITSGKFVNTTNTPKYYFVVVFLLLATTIVAISQKRINPVGLTKK
jgi:hypothetical protein